MQVRQPRQVVGHQRDVGGLQCGVGAGRAHGDPDGRRRQRGGVVDPIADHRHAARVCLAQLFDRVNFLLGHESGPYLVDADSLADRPGGALVVAGEHDDLLDPVSSESLDSPLSLRTNGVGDGDHPLQPVVGADEHDRFTRLLEPGDRLAEQIDVLAVFTVGDLVGVDGRSRVVAEIAVVVSVTDAGCQPTVGFQMRVVEIEAKLGEQRGLAGVVGDAVELRADTLTGQCLEPLDRAVVGAVRCVRGAVDDRVGDRVFAAAL